MRFLLLVIFATSVHAGDFVKVRYTIYNSAGRVLDSTPSGLASIIALERMMPGWRAGIESMEPGQTRRVTVTSAESGGKIPDGESYDIETELIEIIEGPQTPVDLNDPPADAEKTRSGLASRVLRAGNGEETPRRRSTVRVNYTGWTTDGRLFDSTILRGEPAEFRLDNVIAGWTEGLQGMTEGEIRRFWIPAKLAYAKQPDKPQGTLVFDIELIEIVKR
jgi:FKBP-type peptidyl-prolyl cis-trans isomerase